MKNKLLILIALIFIGINNFAQTIIPGGVVSGTWTKANSPYLIQGAIMIANASTLTIQPGVRVEFQGQYKFLVLGKLHAVGNVIDTIVFTANNTSTGWLGIRFENTPSTNDTTRISFCKIQYGKATGTYPYDHGGGFFFENCSKVVISNSNVSNCHSNANGGAMFCTDSKPIITNNIISNNSTSYGNGGAICSELFSNLIISNNIISYNQCGGANGGAINIDNPGSAIISNNIISYNSVLVNGGSGGGGIASSTENIVIIKNVISNNSALNTFGGGISCVIGSSIPNSSISQNIISNNFSLYGGGFFCFNYGPSLFANNIISNNTASNSGGGVYFQSSSTTILNSTIVNNYATKGGGMFFTNGSTLNVKNSILWGNTETTAGNQIFLDDESSDPNFYYCDIMGGQSAVGANSNVFYLGTYSNNINLNPNFTSTSAGSGSGFSGLVADWSLQNNSPCINSGDPTSSSPVYDIAGNSRISGGRIDIGAYESQLITNFQRRAPETNLIIYPNPNIEHVFKINTSESFPCSIYLYDNLGRVLFTSLEHTTNDINLEQIDVGTYHVVILKNDKIIYRGKVVLD